MTDADAPKVDANAKADAPDASDASKIDTPMIYVKTGIGKQCDIFIVLSRSISLRERDLRDTPSASEVSDTRDFDAAIDAKK